MLSDEELKSLFTEEYPAEFLPLPEPAASPMAPTLLPRAAAQSKRVPPLFMKQAVAAAPRQIPMSGYEALPTEIHTSVLNPFLSAANTSNLRGTSRQMRTAYASQPLWLAWWQLPDRSLAWTPSTVKLAILEGKDPQAIKRQAAIRILLAEDYLQRLDPTEQEWSKALNDLQRQVSQALVRRGITESVPVTTRQYESELRRWYEELNLYHADAEGNDEDDPDEPYRYRAREAGIAWDPDEADDDARTIGVQRAIDSIRAMRVNKMKGHEVSLVPGGITEYYPHEAATYALQGIRM